MANPNPTFQSQPQSQSQSQPTPTSESDSTAQPRRPLQREGALIMLSAAEQALEDSMLRSSPPPETEIALGKRPRGEQDEEGTDTEIDEGAATEEVQLLTPSLGNVTASTLRYATHKRLRAEQRTEVEGFLNDTTALGRQAKIYVAILSVENKIDAFRSAAPPYQVSDELKTNINNYALAVLLSTNISAYKGDIPRVNVLNILKRYQFDLPAGIEHDYANWEKVTAAVSYALTQTRSRVKKLIKESITQNTNIFALAQLIVNGTPCRPTVQLCSRVALMRTIHLECDSGDKYWNLIDKRLVLIRKLAGTNSSKATRAFRGILKKDRETYGTGEDYEIADVVPDEWQQKVDDVVAEA